MYVCMYVKVQLDYSKVTDAFNLNVHCYKNITLNNILEYIFNQCLI